MPIVLYWFFAFQLLLVSLLDIKYKKISNTWFIINCIIFVSLIFIFPDYYTFSFQSIMYTVGFIVIGIILFAFKIMGGGDSKFLASFFLLIPQPIQFEFFIQLIYVTIIVSSFLFLMNILKNFDRMKKALLFLQPDGVKDLLGRKFTYAPIIFIAWMGFGWLKILKS